MRAMPHRLTRRATLVLVAVAFGLAFDIQLLLGGGSSGAKPAAKSAPGFVTNAPGPEVDLSLTEAGAAPALRDPRQPRKRRVQTRKPARRRKPSVLVVKTAPKVAPEPVTGAAPVRPTPTAAPRYIPPAPRRSTPKPAAPKPKPAPTSTPQGSGEFDSSGQS